MSTETIEYIVTKRTANFDYIKRAHQGKVYWFNTVQLSKPLINRGFASHKLLNKRSERWFTLGLSLAKLLEFPNGALLVRAMAQLIEEYEHFNDHNSNDAKSAALVGHITTSPPPTAASSLIIVCRLLCVVCCVLCADAVCM